MVRIDLIKSFIFEEIGSMLASHAGRQNII
jgi:hypothetical protein